MRSNTRLFAIGFVMGYVMICVIALLNCNMEQLTNSAMVTSGLFAGAVWVAAFGDQQPAVTITTNDDRVPIGWPNSAFGYEAARGLRTGSENTFAGPRPDDPAQPPA